MDEYRLTGEIIEIKGECSAGHKKGEKIDLTIFNSKKTARGVDLCPFFLHNIFPYLCTFQCGGSFPWEKEENVKIVACPDRINTVTMKIQRIKTAL